jgi:hypothetical protein
MFLARKTFGRPTPRRPFRPQLLPLEARLTPSSTYYVATNGSDNNPGTRRNPSQPSSTP